MEFQQMLPGLEITHLSKTGSDHCPMIISYDPNATPIKKSFKFLKFWIEHDSFLDVVIQNWREDLSGNPFVLFNHQMKKLKKALSMWSKATYDNNFQKVASLEELVIVHETQFELNPTPHNRERLLKVQADFIRYFYLEEEFWKQKAGMNWFNDGDRNTKLFHAQVNGRLKRLQLRRIQNSGGQWLENNEEMAEEAVRFFQAQFHEDRVPNNFGILDHIPSMVETRHNEELIRQPTIEEVKKVVFGLNRESGGGPDVLVNGQPYDFFKSTRGVKQGDPLSPTLFILAAKALSRGLNALHMNLYFCGFGLPKWSPKINHLAYADDTIIFSSSDATSLQLVMEVLSAYEAASGKLINETKLTLYMHHSTSMEVVNKVQRITEIDMQDFPFTYLGCPIFYTRRKMDYYQELIQKVLDKLQSWKGKLLSISGRAVLISHVLQNMPIHILSAVNPPNYVIEKLHKMFAQFFYSNSIGGKRLGALYFVTPPEFYCDESIYNVYDVVQEGTWDEDRLRKFFPEDLTVHILDNIKPPMFYQQLDKP
ncbi:uncharacterized protein [Nicotiana tomentosiformis]|uniref:uncharacterized protein n=1 Tax=Nicotiana tomentosiformis TaxID=4098 RepID=UPI00388C434A